MGNNMADADPARAPKRILMTADAVGGVWSYALELSRELSKRGVEVALATMGPPPAYSQREELRSASNITLFESRFKLEWMEDPWEDVLRAGDWLLRLEREVMPDVVHLNGFSHGSLLLRAPKVVVAHSCVFSWWDAVKKDPISAAWDRYHMMVSNGLAAADVVIAPTRHMLSCVRIYYGDLPQGRVIYNGRAPVKPFRGRQRKEDIILTVGRLWDEAKNISMLDEVATALKWPVYAAGQEHCERNCMKPKNISLLGQLSPPTLWDWYIRASIFVLPARYEPFGLSALEAGLSGCALVLGDIPSLREIWQDAALFVDHEESSSLRGAIERLIEDDELRLRMSSMARARALEFNAARMATDYFDIYTELLNQRCPAECV